MYLQLVSYSLLEQVDACLGDHGPQRHGRHADHLNRPPAVQGEGVLEWVQTSQCHGMQYSEILAVLRVSMGGGSTAGPRPRNQNPRSPIFGSDGDLAPHQRPDCRVL